jgi:hypothetical protein
MEDDILSLLDPTGALRQRASGQATSQGLTSLGLGLLRASRGQPGQGRPSIAQAIGEVGPVALQAYQQSFDKTLADTLKGMQIKQAIAQQNAPKYMTIKTPSGGEQLIQIPRTGTPTPVAIPGLSTAKPIDFDAPTQAFIDLKFGGRTFSELMPNEKAEVLQFQNAPNDEKKASLTVEAKKFKFESGQEVAIPRGRSEMIAPTTITPIAPTAPAVTPKPVSAAEPTEPPRVPVASSQLVQVPMTLVSKTMGDKEVPLVESAGVAPKQKQELILARPQTQSSVEYVVNTNRAMRSLISDILASSGLNDAFGLGGETLSKIPGSPAADVRGKLERLGGNLFIEAITALRNASKTGAGVGNATEKEGDKLERSKANLQQFQTAKAARTELERLLKSLEETETNVLNAYERTYGRGSFQFSPVQTQESKAKRPPLSNIFGTPPQ